MIVKLSSESERIVQEQLDARRYPTATAVVDAAVRGLAGASLSTGVSDDTEHGPTYGEILERHGGFWPEEESVDEFLGFLETLRSADDQRTSRLQEIQDS